MGFEQIEKDNNRKSLVIVIILHSVFFICAGLSFFSCWTMPVPLNVVGEVSVTFGNNEVGSGDNSEPAENPVEQPVEIQEESEPTPVEDIEPIVEPVTQATPAEINTPTNNDSDSKQVIEPVKENPVEPIKPTVPTKNTTEPAQEPAVKNTKPNSTTMPGTTMGDPGNGDDGTVGQKGTNDGEMDTNSAGIGKSSGDGTGPNINGWKFASEPSAPDINTVGIAHIEFKINSFGKVLTAKVLSGAFSRTEKDKIIAEFMKIKLQKLSTATGNQSTYSGTYDWKLEY